MAGHADGIFVDAKDVLGPILVTWFWYRSCDSDCGHMITILGPITWLQRQCVLGYQPCLPVHNKSKWLTMSVLIFQVLITNITGILCLYVPKSVLKLLLWVNAHNIQAKMLQVSKIFSYLSLKWLTPSNGGSVFFLFWQGVEDSILKVTYYCSNHLKLHIYIPKMLLYEIMLVFITEFLVVGSSRAAKSGKITARSAIFR